MTVVGPILVLAAFAAALFFLSQPFWPGHVEKVAERDDLRRADLEAAKIAKYREIRDTELDHATGKLSDDDWRPIDARLRAEAVRILDELDGLGGDTRAPRTDDLPVAAADGGATPAADRGATSAAPGGTPGVDAPSAGTADAAPTR